MTQGPAGGPGHQPPPKRFVDEAVRFILALSLLGSFSAPTIELGEQGKHAVEVSAPRQAGSPEIGDHAEDFANLREALKEALESKDKQEELLELQAGEKLLDRGEQRAPGPDDGMETLAQRHQQELEDTQAQIAELRKDYALKHFGLDRAEREDAMERFDDRAQQTLTMLTERQLDELREVERSRDEVARQVPPQPDLG